MSAHVIASDALDFLRSVESGSVSLIATDPPYFGVKDDAWDNAWEGADDFLSWVRHLTDEWSRILAPHGSLYVFASPQMAGRVEAVVAERLNVLNVITWAKPAFATKAEMFDKASMRAFFPASERIVFAERLTFPAVLRQARIAARISTNDVGALFPSASGGPTGCVRNWELGLNTPTLEQWIAMQGLLALPPYEHVVRPFSGSPHAPYTDVWNFGTVNTYPGKHPCEKPLALMEHIVRTSSRPADLVLDCFVGSGTTALAAQNLGRRFTGCDSSAHWVNWTRQRLSQIALPMMDGAA